MTELQRATKDAIDKLDQPWVIMDHELAQQFRRTMRELQRLDDALTADARCKVR